MAVLSWVTDMLNTARVWGTVLVVCLVVVTLFTPSVYTLIWAPLFSYLAPQYQHRRFCQEDAPLDTLIPDDEQEYNSMVLGPDISGLLLAAQLLRELGHRVLIVLPRDQNTDWYPGHEFVSRQDVDTIQSTLSVLWGDPKYQNDSWYIPSADTAFVTTEGSQDRWTSLSTHSRYSPEDSEMAAEETVLLVDPRKLQKVLLAGLQRHSRVTVLRCDSITDALFSGEWGLWQLTIAEEPGSRSQRYRSRMVVDNLVGRTSLARRLDITTSPFSHAAVQWTAPKANMTVPHATILPSINLLPLDGGHAPSGFTVCHRGQEAQGVTGVTYLRVPRAGMEELPREWVHRAVQRALATATRRAPNSIDVGPCTSHNNEVTITGITGLHGYAVDKVHAAYYMVVGPAAGCLGDYPSPVATSLETFGPALTTMHNMDLAEDWTENSVAEYAAVLGRSKGRSLGWEQHTALTPIVFIWQHLLRSLLSLYSVVLLGFVHQERLIQRPFNVNKSGASPSSNVRVAHWLSVLSPSALLSQATPDKFIQVAYRYLTRLGKGPVAHMSKADAALFPLVLLVAGARCFLKLLYMWLPAGTPVPSRLQPQGLPVEIEHASDFRHRGNDDALCYQL